MNNIQDIEQEQEINTNINNNENNRIGSQTPPSNDSEKRDIGDEGYWSLSSSKVGNGIEQLRDNNLSTFWQSDDIQPHFILIQYPKKVRINEIWLYLDYKTDESYTPSKIAIRIENSFNEMVDIKIIDYEEPVGWFKINLEDKNSDSKTIKPYIKTMTLQIMILQNTHNGRDTHIRGVKIFAPRQNKSFDMTFPKFENNEYTQYQELR
jgi:anaphase-promoting complex subunit 10